MPRKLLLLAGLVALLAAACNLNATPAKTPVPTRIGQINTPLPLPTRSATFTPQPTNTPTGGNNGGTRPCTPRSDWAIVYTVVAGDTVSSLAARTNSSVAELVAGNCLSNPNAITAGQQLRLPRAPQSPPPPTVPTGPVQQGSIGISSSISGDAGFFSLLRGDTISLSWQNPPVGLASASFVLYSTGGIMQTIGDDNSPMDGLTLNWVVPAGLNGQQLMATGRFPNNITASSFPVNVSSAPPQGQNCEITAAQGHTLAAYNQPDANSGVFLNAASGEYFEVLGRTLHGWYAINAPGIPNVPPFQRLKYVPPQSVLYGRGLCAGIPPAPQPGQMATFTNTIAGIAIDYPMGWSAVMQGSTITLSGTDGSAFEVIFGETGQTRPPQDAAAECKSASLCIGNRTVTNESAVTLPSGLTGYRLDLSGDPVKGLGPAVYVFTIISNRNMVLRGFGDLSVYNTILNTVRPA
ncbi:MAG: LysM peptidoglycan-binding domain-containing protein [Chloroflexi bacterium]|nr:LysM peptidoglycan-binding domain-containing protein [Chloroflexota bacterium]